MTDLAQSTAFRGLLKVYLTSDHVSDATGKTVAVVISKNGAAFGNPSAGATNATEIGNGWYYVDLSTTDTGTAGPLVIRGTAASCDNSEDRHYVVSATNGRLTALPAAAAEASGGLFTRGTGAGQINQDANGRIDVNDVALKGTAWATPTVAGIPNVNVKTWNDLATVELPLVPTTAGRKLDVSAGGEAGLDWANVGSPTTTLALTGTTIAVTQKVDVDTIKTNPVVNGGTITFPTNSTIATTAGAVGSVTGAVGSVTGLTASDVGAIKTKTDNLPAAPASTTNITAGTITTVTNLTNAPTSGDLTATMKTSVTTAATAATPNLNSAYDAAKTASSQTSVNAISTLIGTPVVDVSTDIAALPTAIENADAMLDRDMATGVDSGGRTVRNALRFLRNKWSLSGGTLTVTKEDDTTSAWTASVSTDAAAIPVIGSDPG